MRRSMWLAHSPGRPPQGPKASSPFVARQRGMASSWRNWHTIIGLQSRRLDWPPDEHCYCQTGRNLVYAPTLRAYGVASNGC